MEEFSVSINPDYVEDDTPDSQEDSISKQTTASTMRTRKVSRKSFMKSGKSKVQVPNGPGKVGKSGKSKVQVRKCAGKVGKSSESKVQLRNCAFKVEAKCLYTCKVCKQQLGSLTDLQRHRIEHVPHLTEKPNFCFFCEKQFLCRDELESHACARTLTCTLCGQTFINMYDLKNHVHIHRHEETLLCQECNTPFKHLSNAIRHMHIHNGTQLYSCDICGDKFRDRHILALHWYLHSAGDEVTCDICQEKFASLTALMRHKVSHCDGGPYGCERCKSTFSDKDEFLEHVDSHPEENSYSCILCIERFVSRSELKAHMHVHRREDPITCHMCNQEFMRHFSYARHMRRHHNRTRPSSAPEGQSQLTCDVCGKHFFLLSKFELHKRIHRVKQEITRNQATGSNDGMQEQVAGSLDRKRKHTSRTADRQEIVSDAHDSRILGSCRITIHEGGQQGIVGSVSKKMMGSQQLIPCEQQTAGSITKHTTVGLNEVMSQEEHQQQTTSSVGRKQILFSPELLTRESSSPQQTISHISSDETVSDEKTRTCSVCSETFVSFSALEKHLHVHRHEVTFTCNVCHRQITQCNNFIRHMRMHVGKQAFSCGVCGKTSYRPDLIASHMRLHYGVKQSVDGVSDENVTSLLVLQQQESVSESQASFTPDIPNTQFTHSATFEAHSRTNSDEQQMASSVGTNQTLLSNQLTSPNQNQQQSSVSKKQATGSHRRTLFSNTGSCACSICNETFSKFSELESHLHIHRHEKMLPCNVCDKTIRHCNNFIRHMRLHYETPQFSCGICGQRSYHAYDIKKHMQTHTGERPFACGVCEKTFITQSKLNVHRRSRGHDAGVSSS